MSIIVKYSNTSQTHGSKLAKFSNSRFLLLFFTSKLTVPLLSTQIRDFCYFLSPKIREFGGIIVIPYSILLLKMICLYVDDLKQSGQGCHVEIVHNYCYSNDYYDCFGCCYLDYYSRCCSDVADINDTVYIFFSIFLK